MVCPNCQRAEIFTASAKYIRTALGADKNWKERMYEDLDRKKLIEEGYDIRNAQIKGAELTMENHGCISFDVVVEGAGWGCVLADIVSDTVIWGRKNLVAMVREWNPLLE